MPTTVTYRFECRYDGSDYYGWQRQPDVDTIQQQLEFAWAEVLSQSVTIQGSGRTDRGVHALNQVAHIELEPDSTTIPEARWGILVNQWLPSDIAIENVRRAKPEFHARHSASYRVYGYRFCYHSKARFGTERYAWKIYGSRWDPGNAREIVRELNGHIPTRLFSGRGGSSYDAETWELTMNLRQLRPGELWILVGSPSFRYRMVRCLATAVARGLKDRWDPSDLRSRIRAAEGTLDAAPAQGCYLAGVFYDRSPSVGGVWNRILTAFGPG